MLLIGILPTGFCLWVYRQWKYSAFLQMETGAITFVAGRDIASLEAFALDLREHTKQQLRLRYARVERSIPFHAQLQRFFWLRERKAISEVEYEELATSLDTVQAIHGLPEESHDE
jgi:hypothetical protein